MALGWQKMCQECKSPDCDYSEHYGQYLCMDCYNELSHCEDMADMTAFDEIMEDY